MKNLVKLGVILLVFTIIFPTMLNGADQIFPLSKPKVENEIKNITSKKKNIYPQKKPLLNKEKKITVINDENLKSIHFNGRLISNFKSSSSGLREAFTKKNRK